MINIYKYECKSNIKNLLIWSLAVGGMGLVCILLYRGMQAQMEGMADSFASMGAFSDAFGMSTLSIATLKGYFATEIGTIHALGGGMFVAAIATNMLSKEEDQHTAEFTFALPLSRKKIIAMKYLAVLTCIALFSLICGILYQTGFLILGENLGAEFMKFMLFQMLMNVEIGTICLVVSALSKKNRLGIGISLAMILYMYDLMARVIPDLGDMAFISPYSYSNAIEIFSENELNLTAIIFSVFVIAATGIFSFEYYAKRDLAA